MVLLPRVVAAALVLGLLLAGCSDPPTKDAGADADAGAGGKDGKGDASGDGVTDLGAAPVWQKGQWWDHSYKIGGDLAFDLKSIVVANEGGYRLAADSQEDAINHAAFFFHDLGQMDAAWSMHQQDFVFPWYQFPLSDGKVWKANEKNLDFDLEPVERELTMTARLVNASGNEPAHFAIEQRTADGGLRALYDYTSDLGWFQDLQLFDPTSDANEPQLTVHTTATGTGFSGPVYEATADFLMNTVTVISPVGAQVSSDPYTMFTITAEHTHVMVISFAFAAAGAAHTELIAPDGQHWETQAVGDADGNAIAGQDGMQLVVDAVPGDWRFAVVGASPFAAGGGGFAWGVTLIEAMV